MTSLPVECYLGLGTNLGDRDANLQKAIELIGKRVGTVQRVSAFHDTEPWGFESANRFLNACVKVLTILSPRELLSETQAVEREIGRTAKSADGVYHDRVIDIDILLYGNETVEEDDLKIPHPLMLERDFVMKPLNEIMI